MSITYDGAVAGMGSGMGRGAGVPSRVRPARVRQARAKTPVRLTRRGRVVVVLTLLVLLVAGFSVEMTGLAAGPGKPGVARTVTVQPGETLWQLATRVAPGVDPRLMVDQILRANHLSTPELVAGQQLVVPHA